MPALTSGSTPLSTLRPGLRRRVSGVRPRRARHCRRDVLVVVVLQALRRGQQHTRQGLEGVVQMQPAPPASVPCGLVGRLHIVEHEDTRGLQVRGCAVYEGRWPTAIHGRLGTIPAARDGMRFRDVLCPAWQPRPHVAQPGLCPGRVG